MRQALDIDIEREVSQLSSWFEQLKQAKQDLDHAYFIGDESKTKSLLKLVKKIHDEIEASMTNVSTVV